MSDDEWLSRLQDLQPLQQVVGDKFVEPAAHRKNAVLLKFKGGEQDDRGNNRLLSAGENATISHGQW